MRVAYLLGSKIAGPKAGLPAGLLLAVWPTSVLHTPILSSDVQATSGFVLVVWLGLQAPGWWIGPIVGLLILKRPVSVILLQVLAIALVGIWTIRNHVMFGEPVLIATKGGYNFPRPVA